MLEQHAKRTAEPDRQANLPAQLTGTQRSRPHEPITTARSSRLGFPHFQWSLTLLGLCIFTFAITTFFLPVADVGIFFGVLGLFTGRGRLIVPFPFWIFAAFLLWASLASFLSPYPEVALDQLVERLKLLVIMLIALNAFRAEGQLRFFLILYLVFFVLFPARGALVNYVAGYHPFNRALWSYVYENSNDLAALTLLAFGFSIAITMSERYWTYVRLGAGISAILFLIVILLTQSRGVFIGLIVSMGSTFARLLVKRPRLLFPVIIAAIAVSFAVPDSTWERLSGIKMLTSTSTIAQADAEGSAAERFEIAQVAFRIAVDNPVFGAGLGTYNLMNAQYASHLGTKDAHNTYLRLAAETGFPGLVLWLALFGSVLRYAYRLRQQAAEQGTLETQQLWIERALIGFLVAGLFGSYDALTFPYLILAVLWCSAALVRNQAR